jgi:hypothetical protein
MIQCVADAHASKVASRPPAVRTRRARQNADDHAGHQEIRRPALQRRPVNTDENPDDEGADRDAKWMSHGEVADR